MASEKFAPPPYDPSTLTLENHPLKPVIRPFESSDMQVMLAHVGTTNPSYIGASPLLTVRNTLHKSEKQGLPYLLLSIPMSVAKTLDIPAKMAKCTERERQVGQMFVGVCEVNEYEPDFTSPEWRKTLKISINMPDWSHAHGLPKLLIDAAVDLVSYQYDTPSGKPPSQGSLMSRIFNNERQNVIPKPVGDQRKYKSLIMMLSIKRTEKKDQDGRVDPGLIPWAVLYEKWGFKQVGKLEDVIEYEGEGYDMCYYQRKL